MVLFGIKKYYLVLIDITYSQFSVENQKMTGKELRKIIKNGGYKAIELIEKSGIPHNTFYLLYKKEEVEQHHLDKLIDAGLKIPNSTNDTKMDDNKYVPNNEALVIALRLIEKTSDMLNERDAIIRDILGKGLIGKNIEWDTDKKQFIEKVKK